MSLNFAHVTPRTAQRAFAILCLFGLTAGVPWVDNIGVPGFDGREPLTPRQMADKAFARGRNYYVDALEFEAKAKSVKSDVRRDRYLGKAFDRYKASADAYAESLRRSAKEGTNPNYLPQLYLEMANALFKTSEHVAAINAYNEAIDRAPAYLGARYGRARTHLALNQLEAAKEDYAWLLREADTRADAWPYVDALIVEFSAWPAPAVREQVPASMQTSFTQWLSTTREELDETVRWTALEKQAE